MFLVGANMAKRNGIRTEEVSHLVPKSVERLQEFSEAEGSTPIKAAKVERQIPCHLRNMPMAEFVWNGVQRVVPLGTC